jgi:hypothetical protein
MWKTSGKRLQFFFACDIFLRLREKFSISEKGAD